MRSVLILGGMLLMACSGCGAKPVSHNPGVEVFATQVTVTHKGKPVEGARVSFSSVDQQRSATGTTDAAGLAKLTTFDLHDGAVLGKHRVKIAKDEIEVIKEADLDDPTSQAEIKTVHHLPEKFGNYKSSGLNADVKNDPAGNSFAFDLK
ncbi:hypothetical protein [Bremerella cremea]|uniref:hypothetical protein n=1 Tax=Bremerella cremea TaxID=1031537 RepID=UPI0031E97CBC